MANKVNYGLRNVYYATVTVENGAVTYGTPVAIPGAVNLSLSAEGDNEDFYADDIAYFTILNNQGYTGTLEIANVPDSFAQSILNYTVDTKGMEAEYANRNTNPFALLFEVQGDEKATRFVFYNVTVGRFGVEASTIGESIEVQTATLDISAKPAVDNFCVRMKTTSEADETMYNAWFTSVQQPTA